MTNRCANVDHVLARARVGRRDRRGEDQSRVRFARHGPRVDGEQRQNNRVERRQGRRHGGQGGHIYRNHNVYI